VVLVGVQTVYQAEHEIMWQVLVGVQTVYQAEHEIMWQVLLSPFRD